MSGIKLKGEASDQDRKWLQDLYGERFATRKRFKNELTPGQREAFLEGMRHANTLNTLRSQYRRVYHRVSDQCFCTHDVNSEHSSLSYVHKKLTERSGPASAP